MAFVIVPSATGCRSAQDETPPARPEAPSAPERPEPAIGGTHSRPPPELRSVFPDEIGPFVAAEAVEWNHAEVRGIPIPSARRTYTEGQRELTVSVMDTEAAPVLAQGFLAARMLESDTLDELLRAEAVGSLPALLTWRRDEAESSVRVLLPSGVLVEVRVWPADTKDHAMQMLAAVDLHALGRRR